jgi:energy-coupling factor transporter ATP-binding protein EcfA2
MTATAPLKSLSITAFRGSSGTFTLPFERGRKLTLVYGENGSGKTTICDAFEFLAHGRVSSLADCGLGAGLEKYWPAAGKSASQTSVLLETSAGTCTGKIVGKAVQATPAALRPKIELLRRQQILALIQAKPGERYDAIKRFIDIAAFEASEETLRQQGKTLANELKNAKQAEGQSLQELHDYYVTAGSPAGENPVSWAKQKLSAVTVNLDGDIAALGKLRTAFDALKGFPERASARQNVLNDATSALADAEAALAAAADAVTDGAADTLAVLEAGSTYLHDHADAKACPLCLSEEKIGGLADDIAARLANLGTLQAATAARRQRAAALTAAKAAVDQLGSDYASAVAAYATAKDGHDWRAEVKLPAGNPPADLPSLPTWLAANQAVAQTWSDVEAAWRDERKFRQTLKAATERYDHNLAKRMELDALVPKLDDALEHCVEQRKAFTNKIIGDIAQEVGKLYEKVHPGEGLEAIALPLDPKKRASIELQAKFSGQDVPPQAYFSQSHLDTLGLCVFLALAAKGRPEATILILDDVLGSVDEPHVERVVGLIYEKSEIFRHTIVTTHYRPWREKFRWGFLKPDQLCQFVELKKWTIEGGMALTGSVPETNRLKAMLAEADPDVQSITGKAGVILEALLDFITLKYGCAVPRNVAGAYTVGELLNAISGKLLTALRVETITATAGGSPAITETMLKPMSYRRKLVTDRIGKAAYRGVA